MQYRLSIAVAFVLAAFSVPLCAQSENKTYEYDALGRLIKVEVDRGPQNSEQRDYTYDEADNRTQVVSSVVTPSPPPPPPPQASPRDALVAHLASASNSGMWDFRAGTTTVPATVANIEGGLGSFVAIFNGQFDAVDPLSGATISDRDQLDVAATGTYDFYLLVRKDIDDEDGFVTNGPLALRYQNTSGASTGINGAFVDGTAITNQDALHDALDDGQYHRVKAENVASTGVLQVGRSFAAMEGEVLAVVAIDRSEFADLVATETLITNWFNDASPD